MSARALDRAAAARLLARDDVRRILDVLAVPGEETRLVGGCVRDALLGRDSADVDLATTLEPGASQALAGKAGLRVVPTGIEHGTVTILVDGTPFEVTTLREDVETDGRHAVVRFGRDFAKDAERRDFTINALSLDPHGILHDTTQGVRDLEAGRVRFIGDAATRIREDALRILRFFRFHARYGVGPPDGPGLAACVQAQAAVDGLSRERVRAEFLKLLVAPGAVEAVATMAETGILARLIGGPGDPGRLDRLVTGMAEAPAVARLAALAIRTSADAGRLRTTLRLSRAEAADLSAHAKARAALTRPATIEAGAMRALVARYGFGPIAEVLSAMTPAEGPDLTEEARATFEALRAGTAPRPVFPLAGADLVARGLPPGPAVGRGLAAAREHWLAGGCREDATAIEELAAVALKAAESGP